MKKKLAMKTVYPKPKPVQATPVPAPVPKAPGYTTSDYAEIKQLSAAGILAAKCFGSPMVWEYKPEDTARITAVLGT